MGTKAERRAARERVSAYHDAELAALVEHVAEAIDRYRAGQLDAAAVDEIIHCYHRAAQELWKFCWSAGVGAHIELVAAMIDGQWGDGEPIDWWERGQPRRRR